MWSRPARSPTSRWILAWGQVDSWDGANPEHHRCGAFLRREWRNAACSSCAVWRADHEGLGTRAPQALLRDIRFRVASRSDGQWARHFAWRKAQLPLGFRLQLSALEFRP